MDSTRLRVYRSLMDDASLIGPDETAYRLELTPAQLKITHTALKSLLDDFGHEEPDVHRLLPQGPGERPGEPARGDRRRLLAERLAQPPHDPVDLAGEAVDHPGLDCGLGRAADDLL